MKLVINIRKSVKQENMRKGFLFMSETIMICYNYKSSLVKKGQSARDNLER